MKIFYIIRSELDETIRKIIERQYRGNEVKVLELSAGDLSYESIIEDIFTHDRVISW
jgi:hypothetical protein